MSDLDHSWDVTPKEAVAIQDRLRPAVSFVDDLGEVRTVAGVDIGFEDSRRVTRAAAVMLSFPALELQQQAIFRQPTTFPYVPGLLSFREAPAALTALERLATKPDLLLCDGHGRAHPRRFGLACHIGLLVDVPTIGVAKTRLIGQHEPVPEERGAWVPLWHQHERIGAVVRTRTRVKPVYVSSGHRVSLETAVDYILRCAPRYRLPETTRQAHRLASG